MSGESSRYRVLLDTTVSEHALLALDLPADTSEEVAAEALEALLITEPDVDYVTILIADEVIGVSSRKRVAELLGSPIRSVGDGDGATLPGWSTNYRLLRFRCASCSAELRRIHVDERTNPLCPNGHGTMELAR